MILLPLTRCIPDSHIPKLRAAFQQPLPASLPILLHCSSTNSAVSSPQLLLPLLPPPVLYPCTPALLSISGDGHLCPLTLSVQTGWRHSCLLLFFYITHHITKFYWVSLPVMHRIGLLFTTAPALDQPTLTPSSLT